MRIASSVGDRTLLPGTKNVKREKTGTVPRPSKPGKTPAPSTLPLPDQWATKTGSIIVPVELPPKAHALLTAMALHQEHSSVGAYLITLAKNEAAALGNALGEEGSTLAEFFAVTGKEVAA